MLKIKNNKNGLIFLNSVVIFIALFCFVDIKEANAKIVTSDWIGQVGEPVSSSFGEVVSGNVIGLDPSYLSGVLNQFGFYSANSAVTALTYERITRYDDGSYSITFSCVSNLNVSTMNLGFPVQDPLCNNVPSGESGSGGGPTTYYSCATGFCQPDNSCNTSFRPSECFSYSEMWNPGPNYCAHNVSGEMVDRCPLFVTPICASASACIYGPQNPGSCTYEDADTGQTVVDWNCMHQFCSAGNLSNYVYSAATGKSTWSCVGSTQTAVCGTNASPDSCNVGVIAGMFNQPITGDTACCNNTTCVVANGRYKCDPKLQISVVPVSTTTPLNTPYTQTATISSINGTGVPPYFTLTDTGSPAGGVYAVVNSGSWSMGTIPSGPNTGQTYFYSRTGFAGQNPIMKYFDNSGPTTKVYTPTFTVKEFTQDASGYIVPTGLNGVGNVNAASAQVTVNVGDAGTCVPTGSGDGLTAKYYDWTVISSPFATLKTTMVDSSIDFNPIDPRGVTYAGGGDTFSVRWEGFVQPKCTESYTFYTYTDDGVRLWVNGNLVIDKWINQGPTEWSSPAIAMTAGQKYDIKMEYYENTGGAVARLRWSSPTTAKQIIPQSQLYTSNVPLPTVTLSANPLSVSFGGNTTLTYSSTNAVTCTGSSNPANAAWDGGKLTSAGNHTTSVSGLTQTTQFNLQCTNASGNTTPSAVVMVQVPLPFNLNVTKTQGGSVTSNDGGINCGSTCTHTYTEGDKVTLIPHPDSTLWRFNGWSGACTGMGGSNNQCVITVNGVKNINASFTLQPANYQEF